MILVTGATGFIGRNVVDGLRARGLSVRCLVAEDRRRQVPWDEADPAAPEVIIGNVLDEDALFQAVTGVHTIIHLENALWWGNERALERIEIAGTRNLISLARSARVGRIIYLSQLGSAPSSAYLLHRIKGEVESLVRNSGLAFTIIRSGVVFGPEDAFVNHVAMSLSRNPIWFLLPGEGDAAVHPIYIDDLARCIIESLEAIHLVDQTVEVGGPEYITFEDLLLTVMRVNRSLRLIIPVPPYILRLFARVNLLPRQVVTRQWLDILATNRTTQLGNVFEYFGFQPRRFEDTLLGYMPQQNYFLRWIRFVFRRRPRAL